MAAIFYSYKSNNDIFLNSIKYGNPVGISFLPDLVSAANLSIITHVGIQTTETIQYFLTFDDAIRFFFFGRGLGNLVVQGVCFSDNSGIIPGLSNVGQALSNNRGKAVSVSLSGVGGFSGVISATSFDISAEPDTTATFSVTITITGSSIQMPMNDNTQSCSSNSNSDSGAGSTGSGQGNSDSGVTSDAEAAAINSSSIGGDSSNMSNYSNYV